MIIVAADPSLTATGLALLEFANGFWQVRKWAVIRSAVGSEEKATKDLARRLHELGQGYRAFVKDVGPHVVCIEAQVGAGMGKAGMPQVFRLGAAYGTILGASVPAPIPIPPHEVRRRLRGKGEVSKEEIRAYCKAGLAGQHPSEPKTKVEREAVWDAVAVALALEPELERLAAASLST